MMYASQRLVTRRGDIWQQAKQGRHQAVNKKDRAAKQRAVLEAWHRGSVWHNEKMLMSPISTGEMLCAQKGSLNVFPICLLLFKNKHFPLQNGILYPNSWKKMLIHFNTYISYVGKIYFNLKCNPVTFYRKTSL
uniref:Uncharacterized protein n=1 Tax=Sphaerodactylus townsendi TaxID=933632 RepID=A0ACB8FPZ5_9SAUR